MLRITRKAQDSSRLTLIPEGRIASDWVSVLEHECLKAMQEAEVVGLDFSAVTYLDRRGVELLRRLQKDGIQVIHASSVIKDLLEE